jgi:CheY-like chemotaxis protein
MKYGNGNAIVMVDDSETDIFLARRCYRRSKLTNEWLSFDAPQAFLDHLGRVKAGEAPMPALVLLDINMPRLTGFDVLECTKADPYFETLPVFVMLSHSDLVEDRERASALGASGCVTKPNDLAAFTAYFDSLVD